MANKYMPGFYQSDRDIQVFKTLSNESRVDATGKVEKTYGTWSTDSDNVIKFIKGKRVELSVQDVNCYGIRNLIDAGILVRVL